jgi:hypothetical protein
MRPATTRDLTDSMAASLRRGTKAAADAMSPARRYRVPQRSKPNHGPPRPPPPVCPPNDGDRRATRELSRPAIYPTDRALPVPVLALPPDDSRRMYTHARTHAHAHAHTHTHSHARPCALGGKHSVLPLPPPNKFNFFHSRAVIGVSALETRSVDPLLPPPVPLDGRTPP